MLEKMSTLNWSEILRTAGGIVLTLAVGAVALRQGRRGLQALERRSSIPSPVARIVTLIFRWVILIIMAFLVVDQLGVNMRSLGAVLSAFLAIVGIGFVAAWSLLSNISCTILLLIFHPFAIGDEIEIIEATGGQGLRGKVTDLNFMFTTLEEKNQATGETMFTQVPNSMFLQKTIRRLQRKKAARPNGRLMKGHRRQARS